MKINMGKSDKTIRLILGIIVLVFGGWNISTVYGIVSLAVGILLIATSLTGKCPAYVPLGISTNKSSK
ncbi:MAG: DUF2892 domain-containing protein [Melioribacteraceae bacterium]|nr:DUF2892 domain-containing protein [Melioribacteraceae bacterium]MCF8265383.1 DUF2892 domain-containing protein [Melioribacteraceae bacterium]MCF8412277.1 DUF2892 domain-containing protein [Melioribacteraceae bacterium]